MLDSLKHLENFRVKEGPYATTYGNNECGLFLIPRKKLVFQIIFSIDGDRKSGFDEHASVKLKTKNGRSVQRTPTWEEMCIVKDLFWDKEEEVIQIHPKKSQYVNIEEYVLNLWRRIK